MGFYDRDYSESEQERRYQTFKPKSMVLLIIIINLVIFLANDLLKIPINNFLMLKADSFLYPGEYWKLLTYGFAHGGFGHIFGNMLVLFFLGMPVEQRYGQKEFLLFYLATIIFGGIIWELTQIPYILHNQEAIAAHVIQPHALLGASGGVTGIVILMALTFPRMSVYLYGIIEMPMWVLGVLYVGLDTLGMFGMQGDTNVAFAVHLSGAAFAVIYFLSGIRFSNLFSRFSGRSRNRKLGFSVYTEKENAAFERNQEEVDRILKKISDHGKETLTWREWRFLKKMSREYQRRQNNPK